MRFHRCCRNSSADAFKINHLHLHQDKAIENILVEHNTIVASGTGSGKIEILFISILDLCIKNRTRGTVSIDIKVLNTVTTIHP
jgi:ATP-dependent helicase YprA (DUF1998 family)